VAAGTAPAVKVSPPMNPTLGSVNPTFATSESADLVFKLFIDEQNAKDVRLGL